MKRLFLVFTTSLILILSIVSCTPIPTPTPTHVPVSPPKSESGEAQLELRVKEFCQEFYDSTIFHAAILDTDVTSVLWETAYKSVAEADPLFMPATSEVA